MGSCALCSTHGPPRSLGVLKTFFSFNFDVAKRKRLNRWNLPRTLHKFAVSRQKNFPYFGEGSLWKPYIHDNLDSGCEKGDALNTDAKEGVNKWS